MKTLKNKPNIKSIAKTAYRIAMSSTSLLPAGCDSEFLEIDEHTIRLSGSLALRIYSDTKPHNLKIADLQKGLTLVYKGVETVGEGTGFGAPVLKYSNETYFSGSSQVFLCLRGNSEIIRKEFIMDKVPRKRFRKTFLKNQKLSVIGKYLVELYQRHRHFRLLITKRLYNAMGVYTRYVKTVAMGKVIATYSISRDRIKVKMDFSHLNRENLQRVFIANEQGSRYFTRYIDSNGTDLVGKQIGAWEKVEAEWASMTDLKGKVGFRLWKREDSVLNRGREFLKDVLDWAGLDYEINPEKETFEYEIKVLKA